MNVKVGTDTKLLHMLGITQKNVLKADIRLRPDEIATVTLTCAADLDDTQLTTAQFTLWALAPQPKAAPAPSHDLDAMCAAAQERLAKATHLSAEWALQYQREESAAIHVRMDQAIRQHKEAAATALRQLDLVGFLGFDLEAAKVEAYQKALAAYFDEYLPSQPPRFNASSYTYARDCQ